eukprot:TRINITY_DN15056_c0_g1_i1.p2 TRINITY_DN15056_c0_g1~~TRINITY_DN15056_c0_g1_i1.p2  ORF type:complete len:523 (-),score=137.68 TRINITY_DN15056_c0_g1_i1:77-1645(-)
MSTSPEKPKLKRAGTMLQTANEGQEFLNAQDVSGERELKGEKRKKEEVGDMLDYIGTTKKYKLLELTEEESDREVAKLKMVFRLFDKNHDKRIDINELRGILQSVGKRPSHEKLYQIMQEADSNANGSISETEFIKYMLAKRNLKLALTPEEKEKKARLQRQRIRAKREKEKKELARTKESRERERRALMKRLRDLEKEDRLSDDEDYVEEKPKTKAKTTSTTSTTTPKKEKSPEKDDSPSLTRGHSIANFYTEFAGLHDEIKPAEKDEHSNPIGREYDLGREGAFNIFTILVGLFCDYNMEESQFRQNAGKALEDKGFIVEVTKDERKFLQRLEHVDVSSAWIISGDKTKNVHQDEFGRAIKAFREKGRGIAIWADNDPWLLHASVATQFLAKVKLVGNTPGDKTLRVGDGSTKGHFQRHLLTTGLTQLYEGITICYPQQTEGLEILATSSDGKACMAYVDHDAMHPEWGRVVVDCGFTKLYHHWDSAGTARYVRNVAIWLLGLEHRIRMGYPISGPISFT